MIPQETRRKLFTWQLGKIPRKSGCDWTLEPLDSELACCHLHVLQSLSQPTHKTSPYSKDGKRNPSLLERNSKLLWKGVDLRRTEGLWPVFHYSAILRNEFCWWDSSLNNKENKVDFREGVCMYCSSSLPQLFSMSPLAQHKYLLWLLRFLPITLDWCSSAVLHFIGPVVFNIQKVHIYLLWSFCTPTPKLISWESLRKTQISLYFHIVSHICNSLKFTYYF